MRDPDRDLPDPGHESTLCHDCGQREQEDPADLDCTECAVCRDARERREANERSEAEEAAECGDLDHTPYCFTGSPCVCDSQVKRYRKILGWDD